MYDPDRVLRTMRDPGAFTNQSTPAPSVPASPIRTEAPSSRPATPPSNLNTEIIEEATPRPRVRSDNFDVESYRDATLRRRAMHGHLF